MKLDVTFAGDSAFATNSCEFGVVVDDVDLLAAQLFGDSAHAAAELADARALGVDGRVVRLHGDLRAMAGLACERDDLDEPRMDLGHLEREQLADEARDACATR